MTGTTGTTGTAQPQVESSGSRILVVDDEPEIRRIVEARLAGEGFVVEGAATAAACAGGWRGETPDPNRV